jgi:hypothetical protein
MNDEATITASPRHQAFGRSEIRTQILDALRRKYECDLEELLRVCPSFTWNQVFLEVDRLSRTGEVRLLPRRAGVYAVRLARSMG